MSRSVKLSSARWSQKRCSAIAALALSLSACSTVQPEHQAPPLVRAMCPDLVALTDDSFGAWVSYAVETAQQYRKCQAAKLAR